MDLALVERLAVVVDRVTYVVADAAWPLAVAVVVLIIEFLGCVVAGIPHEHTTLDGIADLGVDQCIVDDLVRRHVPSLGVAVLTAQAVGQHVVHALVSQQEHDVANSQRAVLRCAVLDEGRVDIHLARSSHGGGRHCVGVDDRAAGHSRAEERMIQNEQGLGLGYLALHLCLQGCCDNDRGRGLCCMWCYACHDLLL